MSYHRGGHPGAVAVSFSTSTMAPLSPSRRYSGSSGSSTGGGTSGTTGSSTSKYSYRSSGGERSGSYYSSASTTGYRTSSFASSSDYRRPYLSPARSVSSYNEAGSIVGSSTGAPALRYGSASSSSASSTTSSSSSSASRDRNGLRHPTPASLATSAADLYAKYSPTNYVPNIYGSSSGAATASSIGNGHWRPSSSSSSSGFSTGALAELHGGDEYDSCRDRRARSYSSEASSGIGLSSNSSKSNLSVVSPGSAERWSTRREAKRRSTPVLANSGGGGGGGSTVLAGHAQYDSAPAPTEVTLIADVRNNISGSDSSSSSSSSGAGGSSDPRAAATTGASAVTSPSTAAAAATSNLHEKLNDRNGPIDRSCDYHDENPDNRYLDNNNVQNNNSTANSNNNSNSNNNNDRDLIVERENSALDQCRRRRRRNIEQQPQNAETDARDDNNETVNVNNESVVARNNREFNDENNCSERRKSIGIGGSTSGDSRAVGHQHGRANATDDTRGLVSALSAVNIASSAAPTASSAPVTSASSASSPVSPISQISLFPACHSTLAVAADQDSRGDTIVASGNSTKKSSDSSDASSVANSSNGGGGGGGGAGGDADHHRTACTWTKIPTNPDNTELLTNNNGQDREANEVLGVADAGRVVETSATAAATPRTRKSLLWTATNEIDSGVESRDEISEGNERTDAGRRSTLLGSPANVLINNDETCDRAFVNGPENEKSNGEEEEEEEDDDSAPSIYDLNREEPNGISVRVNGVTGRPSGTRSDDPGKPSTSRRSIFGWNDPTIDDLTASSSSAAATAASTSASSSVPVAVHQNLYRGLNEQIDESSNSRQPRSRLQSRRDGRYGLNGLRNIGNTCFMNSVIQCLSNTRPLLEYLLNEQHLHDINTTTSSMKGALIKAFGQVIHELWETSGDHVVNTTALKSQIQRFAPRFMGYSQQDAQEFLRYLLEGLHEDVNRVTVKPQPILTDIPDHYSDSHKAAESWKRYLRSEDSTIVDVFVGQLRSSLHCTSCDHISVTLDPFWDLSLPIPARSGTVKLNQCLEHFTKVETMDGDEKPTCSKCQMRRKCTKSFSIQKFPKILVIHLKRFSPTERFRGKLSVLVDFPLTGLDLSAFAAPGVQGCTYNLYGVANHSGTTYSGHYTAYCKHPYSGEWHEYNDNRVSSVPARSVVSSEAYVLFYEQQPPSPHL